jgi:subtilisin family serine protease
MVASAAPGVQLLENDNGWRPQWGLDRIDQREAVLDDRYHYQRTGRGVHVYVFDSGINSLHEEFAGRLEPGFSVVNDGGDTEDCNGHGTHSASLIGGTTYGVAKEVRIVPVRVLNCNNAQPSSAALYPAIDWIIAHHQPGVPAVVNLSVGMSKSIAFNDAIRALIADGLIVVAAAGNHNRDACAYSPASETSAIVVGAIDRADTRAWYSNHGPCIDLFAPGSDVVGGWVGSPSTYRSTSGTSNAAPLVSGIVALMLEAEPSLTQGEVERRQVESATSGAVYNVGVGSPNLLAYSLFVSPGDGSLSPTTTTVSPVIPSTTAPPNTVPVTSTTERAPVARSFPLPADLTCTTPAERTRFHNVPYVCVNTGDRFMWIPMRYSPGRP